MYQQKAHGFLLTIRSKNKNIKIFSHLRIQCKNISLHKCSLYICIINKFQQ